MEFAQSLNLKQTMSPNMQLSLKILQMNSLDLNQYIRDEVLENPLMEQEQPCEAETHDEARLRRLEWLERMDESISYKYNISSSEDDEILPLYNKETSESLSDVLMLQLSGLHLNKDMEHMVCCLIDNLDENGYLTLSKDELSTELQVSQENIDDAIKILQNMDPSGVGAENLQECLLLQARRLKPACPVLERLIEQHLDEIAKNQLAKLAKTMSVSLCEVKHARELLLTLNPKPGNGFSSYKFTPYIRPDIFIVHFEDEFQVILDDSNQPRIIINAHYREIAKGSGEEAKYINEKLNKAEWLISCIHQRKNTVMRCAGSILSRQICFFAEGPGNLVPMTLADVADDLQVHLSTVSRAVHGKYLQCQWGVFALGDFFSRPVGDSAKSCSQDILKSRIRQLIEDENPQKPISDNTISKKLETQYGVTVARRTIAKYREQMGIPPATGRKVFL